MDDPNEDPPKTVQDLMIYALSRRVMGEVKAKVLEATICAQLEELLGEHHGFILLAVPSKQLKDGIPEEVPFYQHNHLDDSDMAPALLDRLNSLAQEHWKKRFSEAEKH